MEENEGGQPGVVRDTGRINAPGGPNGGHYAGLSKHLPKTNNPMKDLDRRSKRALQAFEGHGTLRFCDLPPSVGRKTMARLVAAGLVEVVDPNVGEHSVGYRWRLIP